MSTITIDLHNPNDPTNYNQMLLSLEIDSTEITLQSEIFAPEGSTCSTFTIQPCHVSHLADMLKLMAKMLENEHYRVEHSLLTKAVDPDIKPSVSLETCK